MSKLVAIITGGSSGIGLDATKKLVRKNIHCIIASRNMDNINEAITEIKAETGRDNVEGMQLDLCNFDSVRTFVNNFKAKNLPLNILINNAGLRKTTRQLTQCGLETTFVANHLGHFLLTNLLLDTLKASGPSRIVVVASAMHDPTKGVGSNAILTLDTFNFENQPYDYIAAYRFSKLANIWFAYHLNTLLQGTNVIVNCLEPGFVPETSLSRDHSPLLRWFVHNIVARMIKTRRTLDHASNTLVDAATNPAITTGGHYYVDLEPFESSPRSRDVEEQRKLWELSSKWVGL